MTNLYQNPQSTITTHHDSYPYISPSKFAGFLKGKVILLTGAGRGIGRASALAFAAAGANVACISRTHSDTHALVQEIAQRGYPRAIAVAADVADADAPGRAVGEVQGELGPIDVLINNAGISRISDMEHEHSIGAAMEVVEVNVRGAWNLIHAVIPSMIERKSGVIINVRSFSLVQTAGWMQAYKHTGRLRPRHYLPPILLGVQCGQSSPRSLYSHHGSRTSTPWHLLLRCAPMYEQKHDVGPRRSESGSS